MNMISLIFKKVYFVHCCIYVYIQSLLYFYLAQEHISLSSFTNIQQSCFFGQILMKNSRLSLTVDGTAEEVGQWRHEFLADISTLFQLCGEGADYAHQIGLSPLLLETFRRPCSLEAKSS